MASNCWGRQFRGLRDSFTGARDSTYDDWIHRPQSLASCTRCISTRNQYFVRDHPSAQTYSIRRQGTLAASGIGDFRFILRWNELNAPLKRNVNQGDVGNSALYLLSDLGSAVTGEIQHVDCGYHTVGMVAVDEAEKVSDLLGEFNKNK